MYIRSSYWEAVGLISHFVQHIPPVPTPADAPRVLAAPICSTVRGIHK